MPVLLLDRAGVGPRDGHHARRSHGYLVVTIDDTYDDSEVQFSCGRLELGTMAPTTPASRLIDGRVSDTRFVIDQLTAIAHGNDPDVEQAPVPRGLAHAIDINKIGMFGPSLGGAVVPAAMQADRRIHAGADLDGEMADHMRAELVTDALDAAVTGTRGGQMDGVIYHSDHGAQYGSKAFADACHQAGILRSKGAVGTCADNAAAESFFASLKREILPDRRGWPTARAAQLAVLRWHGSCNHRRRHSTIGYLAPVPFEQRSTTLAIAA